MTTDNFDHAEFCGRIGCDEDPTEDLLHREAPQAVITPASDPTQAVSLALVRSDEIGPDGEQIVHDVEGMITFPDRPTCYSLDELMTLGAEIIALAARGRYFTQVTAAVPRAR